MDINECNSTRPHARSELNRVAVAHAALISLVGSPRIITAASVASPPLQSRLCSHNSISVRAVAPVDVDAWQWRQMLLSEHGPKKQNARLVALAVARDVGVSQCDAWPSQATIARNAQVGLRTAQRLLTELAEQGWCTRGRGPMTGKGWALSLYTFTVPSHLEQFIPAHSWDYPASERAAKAVASPTTKRHRDVADGAANSRAMVPPTGDMVPPKTPLVPPPEWRTTFPLTNPLTYPREDDALTRIHGVVKTPSEKSEEVRQEDCVPTADRIAKLKATLKKRAVAS